VAISSWARERPRPTPHRGAGWGQRQQCTSATAQLPTAMRATTWSSPLPAAACMARIVTELRNGQSASEQPHDEHQHHQGDENQRHPRARHAGHDGSSSECLAR
jgi:hypothetical protein